MSVLKQIEQEVSDYLSASVPISEGYNFSQYNLVKRIVLYENRVYPKGKVDKQGNYKYWFDIITPRIDSEVKNIDFDTSNIDVYSPRKVDELPCIITNLKVDEWLRDNGQAEEINSAIEEGAGWGNILWKKTSKGYERTDLKNTYIINQTARTVNDTAIIERHELTQSDLRAKAGVWNNIDEVIKNCAVNSYAPTVRSTDTPTTTPYYEVYERNGEVSQKDLFEAQDKKGGDENKYVLAKVIAAAKKGTAGNIEAKYVLFAEELKGKKMSDIYKEYHRGRYKGRWMREGLIELLMDCQTRANEIGNQLARGLEWASKTIFRSKDKTIAQNILTDLKNGDIIKSEELAQVEVRMQGLDQLINDWNRNIQQANDIANSREIVQGDSMPAGMPFKLGNLLNLNANKLFVFIRQKLAIPFRELFEEWIIPQIVKDIKAQEVLRITGDSDILNRLYEMIVNSWYVSNLIAIGPHSQVIADALKQQKLEELKKRPQLLLTALNEAFEDFKPHASVVIDGENLNLDSDLQTIGTFASIEPDPVRKSALIEMAMKKKGIDVGALPKSPPQPLQVAPQAANTPTAAALGTEQKI
nr:hypothetical protein [uncultured bacterium]